MMSTVGFLVALSLSQAAAPAAAGRMSGRITAEGANTPIVGARIMLLPAGRPTGPIGMPPQAVTDQNGRFVFEQVAAGDYRVEVQKAGFAPVSDPTQPPPTITVAAGQSLDNVDFRLQKGGAITGRVLDANGEPMPDASVMAMRREPSVSGGRLFPAHMQGGQQTNDLGEFRVSGLAPGEYFIAAMLRGISRFGGPNVAPIPAGTARPPTATTFYPGTTDQGAAQVIVLAPGAEVGNIVFTMQTAPAFSVSGIVVDESGSPIAHAMVMLMGDPRSGMSDPGGSAQSQDDGRFVIGEVPAGSYLVAASIMMMGGGTGRVSSGSGGFVAFGAGGPDPPTEVVVADADVENVRVVTRRPIPTPGSQTDPDRQGPVPPPDLQGFPTTTAPNELATVALPNNFSDVTTLFGRLPPEVAGHTRSPQFDRISPERSTVGYGEDRRIAGIGNALLRIQAIDVARGDFFPPNWTGGHVIAFMGRGKEAQDAGRDGDLFWMHNETFEETAGSAERFPVYGTLWGRVDSPWIFSVQAADRENRDALLAAFVTAAKSSLR